MTLRSLCSRRVSPEGDNNVTLLYCLLTSSPLDIYTPRDLAIGGGLRHGAVPFLPPSDPHGWDGVRCRETVVGHDLSKQYTLRCTLQNTAVTHRTLQGRPHLSEGGIRVDRTIYY